jgi:hypothetical protein
VLHSGAGPRGQCGFLRKTTLSPLGHAALGAGLLTPPPLGPKVSPACAALTSTLGDLRSATRRGQETRAERALMHVSPQPEVDVMTRAQRKDARSWRWPFMSCWRKRGPQN